MATPPPRVRRPSREETRTRLLEAAAFVFIEKGIGASSVDDIAAAAGFSRGALYSNFADKDAVVTELLRDLREKSTEEMNSTLRDHPDPNDYVRALQNAMTDPDRPIWSHHPILSTELLLWSIRNPEAKPMLQERLDRAQEAIHHIIEVQASRFGLGPAENRKDIAAMLNAMDDGFSLHALMDPSRDPSAAFAKALDFFTEAAMAIAFVEQSRLADGLGKDSTPKVGSDGVTRKRNRRR
jgi:AcrR family transcriptional regulator